MITYLLFFFHLSVIQLTLHHDFCQAYQTKNIDLQQRLNKVQEELDKMKIEKNARLGTYETELDMIFHKIKDKENQFQEEKSQHIALQEKVEELKLEKKDLVKLLTESQVETERFTLVVKRLEEDKKELGRQVRDMGEENKQLKRNVNRWCRYLLIDLIFSICVFQRIIIY